MAQASRLPSGVVTFLVTDIEGSTGLLRQMGEAYTPLLQSQHAVIRRAVTDLGGVLVKTEGDGAIAAFAHPVPAVRAAFKCQADLTSLRDVYPNLAVRMAVHLGPAAVVDDDYVSLGLHQTMRVLTAAHGGQVLLTGPVADAVTTELPEATLVELGRFEMRDFEEAVPLYRLTSSAYVDEGLPPRALPAAAHNLKVLRTRFIGRVNEFNQLKSHLEASRLVTVVGPGGTGKTRLATEVAVAIAPAVDDGVWGIYLSNARSRREVLSELRRSLSIADRSDVDPVAQIVERLRPLQALLLVDNCEQVVDEVADVVDVILTSCQGVRCLATSRRPLGLPDELVVPLSPLQAPSENSPLAELLESEAGQLFAVRAASASAGFRVREEDAPAVSTLCRALDGLPLALELAARRTRTMPVHELARRIEDAMSVLTTGGSQTGSRHRTLRALLDWSHDLLDEAERAVFRRLSVFRDGWTLAAAEAVCGFGDVDSGSVADVLGRLVDHSLAFMDPDDDDRYRTLVVVRQYAAERLDEAAEAVETRRRHASWFAGRRSPSGSRETTFLEREIANFRAALEWADETGSSEQLLELAKVAYRPLVQAGALAEARRWVERAEEYAPSDSAERASIVHMIGYVASSQGDHPASARRLREALDLYRSHGDAEGAAAVQIALATGDGADMDTDELVQQVEEAITTLRDIDQGHDGLPSAMFALAKLRAQQRRLDEALEAATEAEHRFSAAGQVWDAAIAVSQIGALFHLMGDEERAEHEYRRSITLAEAVGNHQAVALNKINLGELLTARSSLDEAEQLYEEGIAQLRRVGDRSRLGSGLTGLAELAVARGDHERASVVLQEALDTLSPTKDPRVVRTIGCIGSLLGRRSQHRSALRLLSWVETAEEIFHTGDARAITEALAAARATLTAQEAAAEQEAGREMSRDAAVAFARAALLHHAASQPSKAP